MAWSFFLTRLNGDGTETRIASDVVLNNVNLTYNLSAPNQLTANLSPEIPALLDAKGKYLFVPWSTAIYAEKDGVIRFGGIVTNVQPEDENLSVTAEGFASYAHGMPYTGDKAYVRADPMTIVKHIWQHLQGQPGGNLGLTIAGDATPVRVGTDPKTVEFTTGTGEDVEFEAGPYVLNWWSTHDLGKEIDDLCETTPLDYVESHRWNGNNVEHTITFHYPNRSARRTDLRFAIGENVRAIPRVDDDGDLYASSVFVLGAGEGRDMRRGEAVGVPKRLRRVKVISDKSASSHTKAKQIAAGELNRRAEPYGTINDLLVYDHPNAPLFAFQPGDDIRVVGDTGWGGTVDVWLTVLTVNINTDDDSATISVEAS
jgi:hypothetical protein